MEVLVGDEVVVGAGPFEPGDEVRVRVERPHQRARLEVQDRPPPGRVHHAAAVPVVLVHRLADLGTGQEVRVARRAVARERQVLVGVRQVGGGRGQEQHGRPPRAWCGAHEEHGVVLARLGRQPHGVEPARQVGGHVPLDIRLPTRVGDVVVVEVDGGVLGSVLRPVLCRAVPPGAFYSARGVLVDRRFERAGGVGERFRGHVAGEVPRGDSRSVLPETRRFDTPVEAGHAVARGQVPVAGGSGRREGCAPGALAGFRLGRCQPANRARQHGLGLRTDNAHIVPPVPRNGFGEADLAVGVRQHEVRVDGLEGDPGARENRLARTIGRRWHHLAREGHGFEGGKSVQTGERAGLDRLLTGGIVAVQRRVQLVFQEARAPGPVVAADEVDQLRPKRVADVTRDHHPQPVPGGDGEGVDIGGDRLGIHGPVLQARRGVGMIWQLPTRLSSGTGWTARGGSHTLGSRRGIQSVYLTPLVAAVKDRRKSCPRPYPA